MCVAQLGHAMTIDKMAHIEKAWFGEPGTCQNALDGIGGGSSNLSFWSFGGLFLITGVVSTLMLLLYLAIFAYREREELREAEAKAEAEVTAVLDLVVGSWVDVPSMEALIPVA